MLVWGSHVKFEMPHRSGDPGRGGLGAVGMQLAPKATVAVCSRQGSKGPGLGGVERRGAWLPLLCIQAACSRASHSVSFLYPMPACCVFLPIQDTPPHPQNPIRASFCCSYRLRRTKLLR